MAVSFSYSVILEELSISRVKIKRNSRYLKSENTMCRPNLITIKIEKILAIDKDESPRGNMKIIWGSWFNPWDGAIKIFIIATFKYFSESFLFVCRLILFIYSFLEVVNYGRSVTINAAGRIIKFVLTVIVLSS